MILQNAVLTYTAFCSKMILDFYSEIRAVNKMNDYIKSDLYRYYGSCDAKTFIKALIKNNTFRFQCAFRLCNDNGIRKIIGMMMWKLSKTKQSIQIPKETKVGYGLYIGHGGPVIVNPTAIIGNNVNLSQFTTIGSNHNHAAVIGNNTYIGPNVCVVENVTIGSNVTIGAGSIVTKDIPDNATAAGNYAKVINYNNPGRYVRNRWSCDSE